jgi:hypothetical protein
MGVLAFLLGADAAFKKLNKTINFFEYRLWVKPPGVI